MDRRNIKTHKAVRAAYFHLLKEKAGGKITVTELTKEAGITRKTFYLNYTSMENILDDFCEELAQELITRLKESSFTLEPTQNHLIFEILYHILEENFEYYRLISMNNSNLFWEKVQKILVHSLSETYVDQTTLSESALRIYVEFFISGLIRLYQVYFSSEGEHSLAQIEEVYLDIVANGAMRILEK